MQTTSHLLMIQPVRFEFNTETAVNNAFQVAGSGVVQKKARQEFDDFVQLLQQNGVDTMVIEDTIEPHTPDAVFPNNWVSFHEDGSMVLYPMYANNRRLERKPGIFDKIAARFRITHTIDLTSYEKEGVFLEGTGSMVLDRENKIAYACLSPRTDYFVLDVFCEKMGYTPLTFDAIEPTGQAIYHTNVMMCVAGSFVVICLDAIPAQHEKQALTDSFNITGKEIITVSFEQMNHFAANMLQVNTTDGTPLLVMSSQAFASLTSEQVQRLLAHNRIIHSPLTTIESNGGGSARCMMAEVYLPLKQ
ncbi:MAG: arginine deiminase-related protein [Bacteroidota bacterium]